MTDVIMLNGGSSSGKSGIARCLQAMLPDMWLGPSVDTLIEAMPATRSGIDVAPDGSVIVKDEFRTVEDAWMSGVATMARTGAHIIIDDVFLGGAASQRRWQEALHSLSVRWVGVRCDAATTRDREVARRSVYQDGGRTR